MAAVRQQGYGRRIGRLAHAAAAATVTLVGVLGGGACETMPRTVWQPLADADVDDAGTADAVADAAHKAALPDGEPAPSNADAATDVTIVVVGDPGTMRLVESASSTARLVTMGSVFEPLITYDASAQRYTPRLATSWTSSDAGRDWILTLGPATFHDGTPVTAADVQYSVEHARNVATQYKSQLSTVNSVTAVDATTVRLRLNAPDGYLLRVLCEIPIVPAHIYSKRGAVPLPIGTGPFAAVRRTGNELVVKRYDRYWGGPARIATMRFRFSRDLTVVGNWIADKGTDVVLNIPGPLVDAVAARNMRPLHLGPRLRYVVLRADRPPLDDPRVRRALSELVDRTQVASRQRGDVPTYSMAWPGGPLDTDIPNERRAGADLLAEAGWVDTNRDGLRDKDGQVLRVGLMFADRGATSRQRWPDELTPLIEAWKAAGVGVDMSFAPESVVQSRLKSGAFVVAVLETELWRDTDLTMLIGTGGAHNYGRFSSPQSDILLRELRATQMPPARQVAARALATELAQLVPIIPLVQSNVRGAYLPAIRGLVPQGNWVDFAAIARFSPGW